MPDEVKLSQLMNVGEVAPGDLFLISKQQSDGSWVSRSGTAIDIAMTILKDIEYADIELVFSKTIIGAINNLNERLIALEPKEDDGK